MYRLDAYHRPASVTDAVNLLGSPNRVLLGGGTTIRHDGGGTPTEAVDLQGLGLGHITHDGDRVRIEAMVTLQDIADSDAVPDLIRMTAVAELPSTLRSLATIGGTIGAAWSDSVLLVALLVHDATVHFGDDRTSSLSAVLDDGIASDELIVAVEAPTSGATSIERTGRTRSDDPIVAAAARRADDGVRLALSGIARTPRLVDVAELDRLQPPGDFRGSPHYRRHLAKVLAARVMEYVS